MDEKGATIFVILHEIEFFFYLVCVVHTYAKKKKNNTHIVHAWKIGRKFPLIKIHLDVCFPNIF